MKSYKSVFVLILFAVLSSGCMTISTSGEYTLPNDQTLNGNLVITSGEATLEEGSRVTGNVYMTSGTLNVEGEVDGDIVFTSARKINLGSNSVVNGDIKGTSGNVVQAKGSQVGGKITNNMAFTLGTGFFSQAFGLLCGIPLILIGVAVIVLSNRRNRGAETGSAVSGSEAHRPAERLKQLKQMQVEGLINTDEYNAKKAAILGEM